MKNCFLASLLFCLTGCEAFKPKSIIGSGYDRQASFSKYATFCLLNNQSVKPIENINKENIERQIERMLQVRGYRHTTSNPDLLVSYSLFPGRVSMSILDKYYGKYDHLGNKKEIFHSPKRCVLQGGVILIQIIDARQGMLLWQGQASRIFIFESQRQDKYMSYIIRSIFDHYHYFAYDFLFHTKAGKAGKTSVSFSTPQVNNQPIRVSKVKQKTN